MAAEIKDRYGVESELVKSGGGIFDIELDGQMLFSRHAEGRFPEPEEIFDKIDSSQVK